MGSHEEQVRPYYAELLALLIVDHPHICEALQKRHTSAPSVVKPNARWVPSASALAALTLAGAKNQRYSESQAASSRSGAGRVFYKQIAAISRGETPLTRDLLGAIAVAVGADPVRRDDLTELDGWTSPLDSKELADAVERAERRRTDRNRKSAQSEFHTVLALQTQALERRPWWYPDTIDILDLAGQMAAGPVLREEELQDRHDGLYMRGGTRLGSSAPVNDLLSRHRVVAVLGDPGAGKSSVLAAFRRQHLATSGAAALFARLDDLGAAAEAHGITGRDQAVNSLLRAVESHAGETAFTHEQRATVAERLNWDEQILLVLDGLDEVATTKRRRAVETVLKTLVSELPCHILISSRYTGYSRPYGVEAEYGLLPLNRPSDFIDMWFRDDSAEARARAVGALTYPSLEQVVQVPLMLSFICAVAEHEAVPPTRQQLYASVIRSLLRQEWRNDGRSTRSDAEVYEKNLIAEDLAWSMAGGDSASATTAPPWDDVVVLEALPTVRRPFAEVRAVVVDDGLLVQHGSTVQQDPLTQAFRWLYRSFHEHLVGRALANMFASDPKRAVAIASAALLRDSWVEALHHTAEILDSRGTLAQLIDGLLRFIDESGLHSATHQIAMLCQPSQRPHLDQVVDRLIARHEWDEAIRLDERRVRNWLVNGGMDSLEPDHLTWLLSQCERSDVAPLLDESWLDLLEQRGVVLTHGPGPRLLAKREPAKVRDWILERATAGLAPPGFYVSGIDTQVRELALPLLELATVEIERGEFEAAAMWLKMLEVNELQVILDRHLVKDPTRPLNEFLRLWLIREDAAVPGWSAVEPDAIDRLLQDAEIPSRVAITIGYSAPSRHLRDFEMLSPWAQAGVMSRPPDWGGVPTLDELSPSALHDALSDLWEHRDQSPDPKSVQIKLRAMRQATLSAVASESNLLISAVHLNDTIDYPRHWWIANPYWMLSAISQWPTDALLTLLENIKEDRWDSPLTPMLISDAMESRPPREGAALLSSAILLSKRRGDDSVLPYGHLWRFQISREMARGLVSVIDSFVEDVELPARLRLRLLRMLCNLFRQLDELPQNIGRISGTWHDLKSELLAANDINTMPFRAGF